MGYFIKTRSGDKGPFQVSQLRMLVDDGRLPATHTVFDGDGQGRRVQELLEDVPVADAIEAEPASEPSSRVNAPAAPRRAAPGRARSQGARRTQSAARPKRTTAPRPEAVAEAATVERVAWKDALWWLVMPALLTGFVVWGAFADPNELSRARGRKNVVLLLAFMIGQIVGPVGAIALGVVIMGGCGFRWYKLQQQ